MQIKYLKYSIFIFCFLAIGSRAIKVSVYDETRARNGILGDGYSDKNVISSAKYFLDSGFLQTKWLPVHDYYPATENIPQVYTHYPALPNILSGVYAHIFNTINEPVLRFIPVLLAVIFFYFIYFVLIKIKFNKQHAITGSSILWLGAYFINYADNLHQHLYGEFLKWIFFYMLYQYHQNGSKNIIYVFWLCLIMILQVNISFEQPVYLGILTVGFSIIYQKNIFTKTSILCALSVVLGFTLHVWQNALYFNSWQLAIEDFIKAYTFRATGAEVAGYVKETSFTVKDLWKIPFDWFNRMERFYLLPGWTILILSIYSLKNLKDKNPVLGKIILVVFVASISWSLLMAQHAYVHGFTNKHFSIFVALVAASGLPVWFSNAQYHFKAGKLYQKTFHVLLVLYSLIMMLTQQVYEVWFKFALLYPIMGYN